LSFAFWYLFGFLFFCFFYNWLFAVYFCSLPRRGFYLCRPTAKSVHLRRAFRAVPPPTLRARLASLLRTRSASPLRLTVALGLGFITTPVCFTGELHPRFRRPAVWGVPKMIPPALALRGSTSYPCLRVPRVMLDPLLCLFLCLSIRVALVPASSPGVGSLFACGWNRPPDRGLGMRCFG